MFRDLSESLRMLLTQPGLPPELAAAHVVFDRPTDSFAPPQTAISLFLYDIREDLERRDNEPIVTRQNGTIRTKEAPFRAACSYLVTAWPVGGSEPALQEQELLSQVLQLFLKFPVIPPAFLQGQLAGQEPAVPLTAARVDPQRNLGEFWSALGGKLRASLTIQATVALDTSAGITAGVVTAAQTRIGPREVPPSDWEAAAPRGAIQGVITRAGRPLGGATVQLIGRGRATTSDDFGRYRMEGLKPGLYDLAVLVDGAVTQTASCTVPSEAAGQTDFLLP